MTTHDLYRLLLAARSVIAQMDQDLTTLGKGRNLSGVPGFEGADIRQILEDAATLIHAQSSPDYKAIAIDAIRAVVMKTCPCCEHGQWEGECCNGANGCSCRGERVPMGTCQVCHGTGQIRADGVGVNHSANADSIRGLCFLGSGPRSGFWAGK